MAQRLVVDCDVHGARDESTEGIAYDLVVRKHGEGFMFLTVDLCEQCSKPLSDLWVELAEVGRSFDDSAAVGLRSAVSQPRKRAASAARMLTPARSRRAPDDGPTLDVDVDKSSTACPVCVYVGASRGALMKHTKARHGRTLNELHAGLTPTIEPGVDDEQAFQCPTCDSLFATPQGMGAHRSRVHGYRSGDDESGEARAGE